MCLTFFLIPWLSKLQNLIFFRPPSMSFPKIFICKSSPLYRIVLWFILNLDFWCFWLTANIITCRGVVVYSGQCILSLSVFAWCLISRCGLSMQVPCLHFFMPPPPFRMSSLTAFEYHNYRYDFFTIKQ